MNQRKVIFLSAAAVAAGVFMIAHLAGVLADKVIFQPSADTYPELKNVQLLDLESGGKIAMRYTEPAAPGGLVFLHCHGNAENLRTIEWRQEMFQSHGYGFCAFDYEGYGRSSGKPSESAVFRNVLRVWKFLTEEKNIPPDRIVIHGFSLGTGAASYLASRVNGAKALILEAPFTSTYAVAGMQWFPGNRFLNIDHISAVTFPILIIHGDKDRIIPFAHGRKLYEKAPSPKRFLHVPGAGHNNIIAAAGESYWQCLAEFLK